MIDTLNVKNYKCFSDVNINLKSLNLFSGANSSGKSSAIQSLRLILDVAREPAHSMGTFKEIRNFVTNAKEYEIAISEDKNRFIGKFQPADNSLLTTQYLIQDDESESVNSIRNKLKERTLFYLPANRRSGLDLYPANLSMQETIGLKGEFIIDYYMKHCSDNLPNELIFDKKLKTLDGQVNYWLKKFTGYTLDVSIQNENYSLHYVTESGKSIRPFHTGTGISYILSIIIVGLISRPGGLFIVENPEIHLHPKAQADMINFFATLANFGVQIIIESHSDHFFNGIRRLIAEKKINKESVAIYFFKIDKDGLSNPVPIGVTESGAVANFEEGMFDQFDNDLDVILKYGQ